MVFDTVVKSKKIYQTLQFFERIYASRSSTVGYKITFFDK